MAYAQKRWKGEKSGEGGYGNGSFARYQEPLPQERHEVSASTDLLLKLEEESKFKF